MKQFLTAALVSVCALFTSTAQNVENSTLWKIEGNGLEQPSFLFGTIHITCNATIEPDVQKALDATSQIVMELDMDDPTMQSKMISDMYHKDGKSIKDFITEADYTAVDHLFQTNLGMSIKMMENVKPFFLSSLFYPKMIDCPMQSFELELMKVAKAQNEDIFGLETVEEQLEVFNQIPLKEQYADLVKMAKDNLDYDKANFAKLLEVYNSENITEMLDLMNDDNNKTVSNHQDLLLDNRNKNWIPKIKDFAQQKPTFFAVGAGHLAGKTGVIKLLRAEGFTVSAVTE